MSRPLSRAASYTCTRCGVAFSSRSRPTKKWRPKYCGPDCRYADHSENHSARYKTDPAFAEKMARISSERMTRRRNGGDPALNMVLAKASSTRLKKLWADPAWREKILPMQRQKANRLNNDKDIAERKRAASKWIMTLASRRLAQNPEWRELMSVKMSEYMAVEPWCPQTHGDYTPNYVSMICKRVDSDAEVRELGSKLMSQYLAEAAVQYRKQKA